MKREDQRLDAQAWDERYRCGDTPWDKGEPAPGLVDFLTRERYEPGTVLVPGCGRGHDCRALAAHGFRVTGLDVSEVAIEEARRLAAGSGVEFVVGDFLTHQGRYDWLFEHTCFCALEPSLRDAYVDAAARVVRPGGWLLGIFFDVEMEDGPPFGATRDELRARFGRWFRLLREERPRSWPGRVGEEVLMWWQRRDQPVDHAGDGRG
ncbi:MAG: TPMT family class I SAM-dependent methyltransferase [Verrucomicrobiae bacterium]|nr:TPMT family class I SAM-dependent methyltransferase [Verrucomicrobiae bacterium]